MWVGHWGPSFILKVIAPEVPLGVLFFAAALPDFVGFFHILLGFGYELAVINNDLPGCYRYVTDMPLSHSLMGNLILAIITAFMYYHYSKSYSGAASVFLATISHFPLEIPQHRMDLRMYPADLPTLGYGLFDSYFATFFLEGIIITSCFYYYTKKTVADPRELKTSNMFSTYLAVLLFVEHFMFTFNIFPTNSVRFVHAPLILFQIIVTSFMAQVVDTLRIDRGSPLRDKIDKVKKDLQPETIISPSATGSAAT